MEVLVFVVGTTYGRVTDLAAISLDSGLVETQRSIHTDQFAGWAHGRVLAAYNLPFVQRLLEAEFKRCGYILDAGHGVDIQLENIILTDACEKEGITRPVGGAMAKADAAAELLRLQAAKGLQPLAGTTPARVTK